jgi:hypothetical protein
MERQPARTVPAWLPLAIRTSPSAATPASIRRKTHGIAANAGSSVPVHRRVQVVAQPESACRRSVIPRAILIGMSPPRQARLPSKPSERGVARAVVEAPEPPLPAPLAVLVEQVGGSLRRSTWLRETNSRSTSAGSAKMASLDCRGSARDKGACHSRPTHLPAPWAEEEQTLH